MSAPREPSLEDSRTLRDFITRIAQGIYIVTPDGRIVDANPALLEIFGAESLAELKEYRSEDLVPDPGALAERRRLLAERGWIRHYEYEIRRLDGTRRRVRDTVFVQRDESGQVVALHGILSDVTDETTPGADSGTAADDSTGRRPGEPPLASFFTGAPAGLAILDRDLRFLRINQTLARMHRLPVEDHLDRELADAVPGLAPPLQPILEQVLETGRPALDFELAIAEPSISGDVRHWRFSCFPLGPAEEDPTAVGLIVVDVTDARQPDREAWGERQYLAALIDRSPLAMATLDRDARVVSINQAFERLFLYTPEEATGREIDELIVPEAEKSHARALTRRTQGGETLRTEGRRQRRDGTVVEVTIDTAPIVLGGRRIGTYAIYRELARRGPA